MQNIENLLFFSGEDYLRVSKGLVRTIGVECAFMFAEFVDEYLYYYKEKYNTLEANNGWFFSTADNIKERTGWSADKQERIIQVLIEKCLIQKKVAGVPAKRFFYINTQKAQSLVNEYHETTFRKKRKLDSANNGNLITENSETIIRRPNKENLKTKSNKDKDTASGLSQSENPTVNVSFTAQKQDGQKDCILNSQAVKANPTVKESLTVQNPKKEEEFEQFWLQWKDLCKNKGSQTGGKKPAKIEYEKVLKKVKQEDIIRVLNAFNNYIQIAFANNKNCERWIKSENWDNIDEAVADYKQQEENIKKQLIKEGKPVPLPQKTPLEAQKEVVDTNALLELRNAKYNALTQKQKDTSNDICKHLLTYFGEIHHKWIKSSIWFQQTLQNDEIDLHIRIFSEHTRGVIELNYGKIIDTIPKLKGNTVKQIIIKVIQ